MNKYEVLGQAFEDLGTTLSDDLENLGETAEDNEQVAPLYTMYAMLLNMLSVARTSIAFAFDEIDAKDAIL